VDFDELYERFRRPVWRLARRLAGSEEEAFDLCQEIFLRVWRGLPGFRGEARLSTWVFQIAWNHLRAHRKRQSRRREVVADTAGEARVVLEELRDPRPDPERGAAAAEALALVAAALDGLPEHFRVVVWLRDGEGLSYEEIATVLGVPIGTVRSRLARARALLRTVLG
jgi:RNA polymerase sigma-70 factor (ECF subfamily)